MNQPEPSGTDRSSTPLTLEVKVLAAVATLVVLLVIAIAIGVSLVVALGHNASLAERQGRYTTAVNAAALWAKTLANDERGYFISGDIEFVNQMEGETELARAAFAAAAEAASADQRATLAEAREGFERWLEAVRAEIAVYQSGDEEAAIATSLGPTRTMRHSYEGWLSDAAALGVVAFQDATAAVSGTSALSILILVGYLVVAVVIAVAIALWVVRTVIPTYTLRRLAEKTDDDMGGTRA
jgi:CHASE3 domain sensor protein